MVWEAHSHRGLTGGLMVRGAHSQGGSQSGGLMVRGAHSHRGLTVWGGAHGEGSSWFGKLTAIGGSQGGSW